MILVGDCLEVMRGMAANSIDVIVTDPPYGLSFMGKRWDYDVPSTEIWAECLRLLKPGGHLLAFAGTRTQPGTRTQHRMAVRIEDAGFEIRDMIAWVYGSGFPKSHNGPWGGTALKLALEPITVARKPLAGTVAANWQLHGTGGLNIDASRIETIDKLGGGDQSAAPKVASDGWHRPWMEDEQAKAAHADRCNANVAKAEALGRWPANLIHDGSDEVLAAFPQAPGQQGDLLGHSRDRASLGVYGDMSAARDAVARGDSGSAARFFYCAKASRKDRDAGLDGFEKSAAGMMSNTSGQHMTRRDEGYQVAPRANDQPTVKPTDLMRYLCRLVTPAGGVVLDPFMGSGSTGKAAVLEGFQFIGIEMDPTYAAIAEARIRVAQPGLPLGAIA
ncbi:site-specific DNA-methyltransferase [Stenotrophomonas maltophilia]|uniref:DNA-methyltransferase n=1 Tax=Stenotrophomonas geniculata TaxID=86188 RepID=UPI00066A9115|nr:site-specific DNA-methyltransferase [Stenotrophomonas geniculata]MBH1404551.1 site-specific DNA-methyltransferase [Stenotrophomonas maltophilia]